MIYLDEYLRRRDALMAKLVALVTEHRGRDDLRFVAAGGDGTVSWVAELVGDACVLVGTHDVPPIAVLSLGTGNELARVTGWGATYQGESLVPFIRDVASGKVVGVDSWLWRATPLEVDSNGVPIDAPRRNLKPSQRVVGPHALHDFEGNMLAWEGEDGGTKNTSRGVTDFEPETSSSRSILKNANGDASPRGDSGMNPRRLSVNIARKMALENDDLPHLPELAFAPPPLTPPGNRVSPSRNPQPRRSENASRKGIRPIDERFQPPKAQQVMNTRRNSIDMTDYGDANALPVSRSPKDVLSNPQHRHVRSGSFGGFNPINSHGNSHSKNQGIEKSPVGPTNNGIGFGRRKNHSRGGSVEFLADGFDDVFFDGESDDDDGALGIVEKTSVCFFSIGFDASIAMQFHQLRERTPCCADSVTKIVAGHAVLGLGEAFSNRKYLRPGVISLRVDGKEVVVPAGARTLQFFNIHSSATGIDFFGCQQKSTPEELQHYEPPNIGDGLIEIVATMSTWHLGAIRLGFGHSHRVAQGASVEIVLRDAVPVQVDGEPWLQPPAVIHVSAQGKIPFVLGKGEKRNVPSVGYVRKPSVVRNN